MQERQWSLRLHVNGRNNSQHCCANDVVSCCVCVGSDVQADATTLNNVGTCSASCEGYNPYVFVIMRNERGGPNSVGRAVQTDPTLFRYASAITEQKNVRSCWLKSLTRFKLCATTRNNMQQGVQSDATCNIQQCWELLVNNVASVCTQPYIKLE